MSRLVLPRELDVGAVNHPLNLHGCLRVDHPIVDRLRFGWAEWPGDARLCIYANTKRNTWDLYRLEFDASYRLCARSPRGDRRLGDETFWHIVRGLQNRDTRLGYDVVADVEAHEEQLERDIERRAAAAEEDAIDRFGFELVKAGATDYL